MAPRKTPKRAPAKKPQGARRKRSTKRPMTVVAAVKRDLATLAKRDRALAESGLAASALALARELDQPENSATSRSMCARALLDTMDRLLELAPEEDHKDGVDELTARRAARRAAGSAKA